MEGSVQDTAPLWSWLDRLRRLCCRPGKAGPLEDQQIASAWNKELVLIQPCGLALIHQGWRLGSGRCESLLHWRQLSSFTRSFIQQRQAERGKNPLLHCRLTHTAFRGGRVLSPFYAEIPAALSPGKFMAKGLSSPICGF